MASRDGFTRREMIRSAAAAPFAAGILASDAKAEAGADDVSRREPDRRPRNIIFMVSDGMSAGVPALAEPFSQLVRSPVGGRLGLAGNRPRSRPHAGRGTGR